MKLKSVFLISHKVFDTWGFRLGRVHKQFEHYGLYEQCLNFDQLDIQGKNCLAEFSHISNEEQTPQEDWSLIKKFLVPSHVTSALVGVCVPQVCNSHDLNSLGNTYLNDAGLKWRVQHCEKPLSFGNLDIFVVYVCLLAFEVCGVCPKFCWFDSLSLLLKQFNALLTHCDEPAGNMFKAIQYCVVAVFREKQPKSVP